MISQLKHFLELIQWAARMETELGEEEERLLVEIYEWIGALLEL